MMCSWYASNRYTEPPRARGFGGSRWAYVFFIDIEGHRLDPVVARALEELRGQVGFLKELGSYPRAAH